MKVRFQPRTSRQVEIRDMRGHRLGTWIAGQEEEIDPNERAAFREANGTTVVRPVLDSIFSCGPDFVDAATGKNPWFVCDECGENALDEHFTDRATLQPIYVRRDPKDPASPRLCLTDFLAQHPEYEQHHAAAGAPHAMLMEARKRRGETAPVPDVAPSPGPAAAVAPSDTQRQFLEASNPLADADEQHENEGHE